MIKLIRPDWNAPSRVQAFCTTRLGGVSQGEFDSLNLGAHVGDQEARVSENRSRLRNQAKLPAEPCWINQTHGTRVVTLEDDEFSDADAAVTRAPGRVAAIMIADCLPILLCNREATEVAAIHAGWRGLQAGVIQSALEAMQSAPDDLMAWVGPGISQANFEVGDEVRLAFLESTPDATRFFSAHGAGHWLCDLGGLAESTLGREGVGAVSRDRQCTHRDRDLFYSYRRDGVTGRMAALIWINPEA